MLYIIAPIRSLNNTMIAVSTAKMMIKGLKPEMALGEFSFSMNL